jgi:molecular chaperone GrpE
MFKDKNKNKQKDEAMDKGIDIGALQAELNVLREEMSKKDEAQDKLLRLQAEFDNFRKRSIRERQEFVKYANEGLIIDLVGMLDNFERSIKAADQKQDFRLLHQGVDMISRQLHKLLEEKGLKKIISKGERFDPSKHEAMEVVESDDAEEGCILEEFQPGYMLNDRVIRPAMVKVAKPRHEEPVVDAKDPEIDEAEDQAQDEDNGKDKVQQQDKEETDKKQEDQQGPNPESQDSEQGKTD